MERDLMRIPQDIGLSLEYLAMSRELCTAYSLLERSNLKVSLTDKCFLCRDLCNLALGIFQKIQSSNTG